MIFDFLADDLRLTCTYLNDLPKDNLRRRDNACQLAEDKLSQHNPQWTNLYWDIKDIVILNRINRRQWMDLYSNVYNLYCKDPPSNEWTHILIRCISLQTSDRVKRYLKLYFQYVLRHYGK